MKRTVTALASALFAAFAFSASPASAGEVDDGTVWNQMDRYAKFVVVEALISGHEFGSEEIAERIATRAGNKMLATTRPDSFSQSAPYYAKRLDVFYSNHQMLTVPFGAAIECMADHKDGARCTKSIMMFAAGGQ